jgi:hypothetical protein
MAASTSSDSRSTLRRPASTTNLVGCVPNLAGGGAHNAQIHPSGTWVAMMIPRGDGSIDIVDLRNGQMRHTYRFVQSGSLTSASCPATGVTFTCVSIGRSGNWSPHDLPFRRTAGRHTPPTWATTRSSST